MLCMSILCPTVSTVPLGKCIECIISTSDTITLLYLVVIKAMYRWMTGCATDEETGNLEICTHTHYVIFPSRFVFLLTLYTVEYETL